MSAEQCENVAKVERELDFALPSVPLLSLLRTDTVYRLSALGCVKAQLLPNLQYQQIFINKLLPKASPSLSIDLTGRHTELSPLL